MPFFLWRCSTRLEGQGNRSGMPRGSGAVGWHPDQEGRPQDLKDGEFFHHSPREAHEGNRNRELFP